VRERRWQVIELGFVAGAVVCAIVAVILSGGFFNCSLTNRERLPSWASLTFTTGCLVLTARRYWGDDGDESELWSERRSDAWSKVGLAVAMVAAIVSLGVLAQGSCEVLN
jgi:uncharacterized membrane protein YdfJ with MMPL/SSD domain